MMTMEEMIERVRPSTGVEWQISRRTKRLTYLPIILLRPLQFDIKDITRGRAQVIPDKLNFLQKLHVNYRWNQGEKEKKEMVGQLKQITRERYPERFVNPSARPRRSVADLELVLCPCSPLASDESLLRDMIEIDRVRLNSF